jgi:hypothetical protein
MITLKRILGSSLPLGGETGDAMLRSGLLALVVSLIAGCAHSDYRQAEQELTAGRQACEDRLADGTYKTWTERAGCINGVVSRGQAKYNLPDNDLILLASAYRSAIAARVDAGEVTAVDARLMEAQVRTYLIEQMQVRRAVASQSQAMQTMAAGSALAGFAAWQQVMQPRAPITCQQVGASVTCR